MDYKKEIQESLDENQENYKLKTNTELIDVICDFGCGETEFHTADIERLIKEHKNLIEVLNIVTTNLSLSGTNLENSYRKLEAIKLGKQAIELYSC
jgi:hypothetical protein